MLLQLYLSNIRAFFPALVWRLSKGGCCRRHGAIEVMTYLVEAKEAQVSHNIQGTDPGACGDLSGHLQTDLNDLQRIGENHLGTSSL